MMSDVQQPIVAPVDTEPKVEDKPLPLPKDEKTANVADPLDSTTLPAAASEPVVSSTTEKTVETKPSEIVAPATEAAPVTGSATHTTSGFLGYKAPGLLKSLLFSKKYLFLGDEPISHEHLGSYLRGEKAEHANRNAAWSSKTGKGLLFIAKSEAEQRYPQDIINLSDASAIEKFSPHEFSFRVHAHKHVFKANSDAERDAWVSSIETAITEAKANSSSIVEDDEYKKTLSHLEKPAATGGAVAAATGAVIGNKHEAATATEPSETAAPTAESPAPAAEKRSSSRGKRTSIFGAFKNKVEDLETGKKLKKEEKAELKNEHKGEHASEAVAPVATEPVTIGGADAPLDAQAVAERATGGGAMKDGEIISSGPVDNKSSEPTAVTTTPVAPKPSKRSSIFGNIYQKVRSPATEKRENEVGLSAPAKDTSSAPDAPVVAESATVDAPATSEAQHEPAVLKSENVVPAAEEPKVDSPTVDHKPKKDFLGNLITKARAKSPISGKRDAATDSTEKTPVTATSDIAPPVPAKDDVPVTTGEPTTAPVAAAAPETIESASPPPANRRRSYFGNFGGKKDKSEGENENKPFEKITSIFRRPSQAQHKTSDKDLKKQNASLVAAEEKIEPVAPAVTGPPAVEDPAVKPEEKSDAIDETGPATVNVSEHQKPNPVVSATV